MAKLFQTPQKGQQRASRERRKAVTQQEIDELKKKVAVTIKIRRPFVLYQAAAPGEEIQKLIIRIGTNTFENRELLTPPASTTYWTHVMVGRGSGGSQERCVGGGNTCIESLCE